ncbi:hypothetical protein [Citrobacter phage Tr1]|nr:hypothetical protein [Citrobacter phage Tr1]
MFGGIFLPIAFPINNQSKISPELFKVFLLFSK